MLRHTNDEQKSMINTSFKFMVISVFYPMIQLTIYAATGDISALSFALVLLFLWFIILYCFIQLFIKSTDDNDEEV